MANLKARNLIARDLFPIPENTIVEETRCITLQIPDDDEHLAVFAGALALLEKWNSWQKDGTTNARDCANTWRAALEAGIEACMSAVTDVRQNEESPCILEKQIDEGDYVEFANLQLCPPRIRRNEGRLQWWNGDSWVDLPEQGDEQTDGTYDPPFPDPPPGETGNCLVAENIVALLQQQVTDWQSAFSAGTIALAIVTGITGILSAFFIPFATPVILGFATGLVALGAAGIEAAFTEEVYDRLKCIIYCHAAADGSITVDSYQDIKDDIAAESGTAWDLIATWIDFFGNVGLNRAGNAAGITTGDCDDCTCQFCYEFNFVTGGAQDWTAHSDGGLWGTHSPGNGWVHSDVVPSGEYYRAVWIERTFDATTLNRIEVRYDLSGVSTNTPTSNACAGILINGSVVEVVSFAEQTNGENKTLLWAGEFVGATSMAVFIDSSYYTGAPTYTGSVDLEVITVKGQPENPFGSDNC